MKIYTGFYAVSKSPKRGKANRAPKNNNLLQIPNWLASGDIAGAYLNNTSYLPLRTASTASFPAIKSLASGPFFFSIMVS